MASDTRAASSPSPSTPPGKSSASPDSETAIQAHFLRILRLTLGALAIGMLVWLLGDVLMVIFASVLCAVVLHGLARILVRHLGLPHGWALSIVVVTILGIAALLAWNSGPAIANEAVRLQEALRQQETALRGSLQNSPMGQVILKYLPASLGGQQTGGDNSLASLGSRIAGSMTGILGSAFGAIGTIVVVLIAGLYFAMSPASYANGLLRLVPQDNRPKVRGLLLRAGRTLWAWVAGQALDMLVVGTLSGIGLWFIGVPLALALGVLAGLCNFVPYIGAIMGAVPALLLALSLGTRETIMVAALYGVIQFLEGNVLAPFIQRHAVQMPPALTVLSQTLFGAILGFPGLILASPLTAVLLAILDGLTRPLSETDRL
ncbi:AI-2E family transporter [Acetobacter sp. TBRC 12305]|uniref:AI-2E family transporter n=1 Tax=Acetobacter garciniae TaxID=2817435 RepID=A0A939KRA0_9PROT|nr:AI-2E family transporter [Acetobacter garciniae]MBO1326619.1 AI-2E family transporter [Acetobacter garciniae]MBX0346319.1 AI-2E family transporter [Acetobacter garciniae]